MCDNVFNLQKCSNCDLIQTPTQSFQNSSDIELLSESLQKAARDKKQR